MGLRNSRGLEIRRIEKVQGGGGEIFRGVENFFGGGGWELG